MLPVSPSCFAAIDFETADPKRDSACAVAVVRVEHGEIVQSEYRLIRPPRKQFNPFCVKVHGIRWSDVANEPVFGEVWPELTTVLDGVDFIAAHNATFDRSVLKACTQAAGLPMPQAPFMCSVELARRAWAGLVNHKLNTVAEHLEIPLVHHNAASDAEACAQIVVKGLAAAPDYQPNLRQAG